jgi:hypothetical protein
MQKGALAAMQPPQPCRGSTTSKESLFDHLAAHEPARVGHHIHHQQLPVGPGEKRRTVDLRRSGAVEADAGGGSAGTRRKGWLREERNEYKKSKPPSGGKLKLWGDGQQRP